MSFDKKDKTDTTMLCHLQWEMFAIFAYKTSEIVILCKWFLSVKGVLQFHKVSGLHEIKFWKEQSEYMKLRLRYSDPKYGSSCSKF